MYVQTNVIVRIFTHIVDIHKKGIITHINTHIFVWIHKYNQKTF